MDWRRPMYCENMREEVAVFLRERGRDVLLVRDVLAPGVADPVIVTTADVQGAIIITVIT